MNHQSRKKVFQYFFLSILFVLPLSSQAQTSPYGNRSTTDAADALSGTQAAYSPPAVYATKTTLNPIDASGAITGTFTILNNSKETVGDIKYRVELLEALPTANENELVEDTGRLYDSALSPDVFALLSGEEKVVPFTYTPPAVPAGEYRLVVQLTTSQGRDLGWDTTTISLQGSADSFIDLVPGNIILPEFPGQDIPHTSGPNVSPNSSFSLEAIAINPTENVVTVTPTLTVYSLSTSKGALQTIPQTSITLQPKQELELTIPVAASATAGPYYGTVSLVSGTTRVSPIAEYRWVVRGSSGSILSARINKLFTKATENVEVAVDYAGPADAETVIKGTILIEVLDTNGVAGTITVPRQLELTDGIGSGISQVPLSRDLIGTPGLRITLTAEDGTVLDIYNVDIPLSDEQLKALIEKPEPQKPISESEGDKYVPLYILIASLFVGLLALVLFIHKKKHSAAIPLGLFLVLSTVFTVTQGVLAQDNGIDVAISELHTGYLDGKSPRIEIFINKPIHNAPVGTYTKTAIPFEYRVVYGVCNNHPPDNRLLIRYDKNGGKHSNLSGPSSSDWKQILSAVINTRNCKYLPRFCLSTRSGSATLNLSDLNEAALNTTLQVGAFWSPDVTNKDPEPTFEENDFYIIKKRVHIVNLWLNLLNPATVTPPVTPPPTITPTPFYQFSCTPQTQTIPINTNVTVSEDSFEGTFSANWSAPGAKVTAGTGTTFTTKYTTPGEKIITATSINFPGSTQVSTCRIQVTGDPNANKYPVAVAKMSIDNGATYSSNITVTQGIRVPVRITAGEKGGAGSFDPDGWDTVSKGVSKGGKIEWNNNLWLGEPKFEKTFPSPATPSSADMILGDKIFTLAPGTYTYNLLKITDAGGLVSNTGTVTLTVLANPDPNANRSPFAAAKMSIDGGKTYSSNVTVTQGVRVPVRITAGEKNGQSGSYDPDGWDTANTGVSTGGKIEWNNNLWLGEPRFEKTFSNPTVPSSADMDLGEKTFTLAPGTYTYNLLRITDASGYISNIGTVTLTVLKNTGTPTVTPTPTSAITPTPTSPFNPGGFEEVR